MPPKAPFLKQPYAGYFRSQVPPEDEELTHVGPGTPGGEYLRRFWQPIAFSSDLADLPVAVRIMGEDLVLFRDLRGKVGLMELHCPHRGASLEFGRLTDCGIRCPYHGWQMDVDGRVVDTPGEPADSTLKDRLFTGAYPTIESRGLVFAYMGPPDLRPELPDYDSYFQEGCRTEPGRNIVLPCNWLQMKENAVDPAHLVFLHTIISGTQFNDNFGVMPETEWMDTPLGVLNVSTRRVGDNLWIRISEVMQPNVHQFPPTVEDGTTPKEFSGPLQTMWAVPIDDTTTISISLIHIRESEDRDWEKIKESFGQTADRPYEERQRIPGDYDTQVSQRPIAVHAMERLATTDRGVIMFRKQVRQGIRDVEAGRDPKGLVRTSGSVIPTYTRDVVVRMPKTGSEDDDSELQRQAGREVVEALLGEGSRASLLTPVPSASSS